MSKYTYIYIRQVPPYKLWNDVEAFQISWNECRKIMKNEHAPIIYKIKSDIKYLKLNYPFEQVCNKKITTIDIQPQLDEDLYAIELFIDESFNIKLIFPNE